MEGAQYLSEGLRKNTVGNKYSLFFIQYYYVLSIIDINRAQHQQ